jgi:phenylacetate-coenzyme A ligase PaaK-like adenylate-forming protein
LDTFKSFESKLYHSNAGSFTDIALETFRFQALNNPVYADFMHHLGVDPDRISTLEQIPFLPISFFKHHAIKTGDWQTGTTFTSSGTTGADVSRHAVKSLEFYQEHARKGFELFFGDVSDYNFLALLPSYLERQGSSLIAMIDYFIRQSGSPYSAFYLHDVEKMMADIESLRKDSRKTIVWGVSFALLDLAEKYHPDLGHCIVFETGGMKGRRKELTRAALHDALCKSFGVDRIYSEYGMTELLSQAYSTTGDRFQSPPWMRVIGREITDPMTKGLLGETSGINVIDLANRDTISFIETEDLGKIYPDGTFEVLGRMDNSDVRGCNLLVG